MSRYDLDECTAADVLDILGPAELAILYAALEGADYSHNPNIKREFGHFVQNEAGKRLRRMVDDATARNMRFAALDLLYNGDGDKRVEMRAAR